MHSYYSDSFRICYDCKIVCFYNDNHQNFDFKISGVKMSMFTSTIFLFFLICQINAAPTDGPIRIELLTEKVSGLSEQAHQKFSTLSDTALQNVVAVNDLVSANLVTVGDYLTTGSYFIYNRFSFQFS